MPAWMDEGCACKVVVRGSPICILCVGQRLDGAGVDFIVLPEARRGNGMRTAVIPDHDDGPREIVLVEPRVNRYRYRYPASTSRRSDNHCRSAGPVSWRGDGNRHSWRNFQQERSTRSRTGLTAPA